MKEIEIRIEARTWCSPVETDHGATENQVENMALHFFKKGEEAERKKNENDLKDAKEKKKICELCKKKDRQVYPVFVCDECSNEYFEKVKEPIEKLYNLNADISLAFVAMKKEPTTDYMIGLNKKIGEIIKELRNIN